MSSSIKESTEMILDKQYFEGFSMFFNQLFDQAQNKNTYLAFVARRCSCLACIFLQILGKQNKDISERFLTDNSLLNFGASIGRRLAREQSYTEELPRIILVDDMLSYGRAVMNTLNKFKEKIDTAMSERGIPEEKRHELIEEYFYRKVSVRVYAEKDQATLLPVAYRKIITGNIVLERSLWNDLSIRLSELLLNSDVANAAFVMTADIPKNQEKIFEKQKKRLEEKEPSQWIHLENTYRKRTLDVYFRPIPSRDNCKLLASVRCTRSVGDTAYRLSPFVFFAEPLSEVTLIKLEQFLFENREEGYDAKYASLYTRQNRLEFVTMCISQTILSDFLREVGFSPAKKGTVSVIPYDYDREKVSWNFKSLDMSLLVKNFLSENMRRAFAIDDLCQLFFKESRFPLEAPVSITRKQMIAEFENVLFHLSISGEVEAYNAASRRVRPPQSSIDLLYSRMQKGSVPEFIHFIWERMMERYKGDDFVADRGMGERPATMFDLIAVMFQMMDAGMMSVVSRDSGGLRQEIRICEQAMALCPRRNYCHLDVLQDISDTNWYSREGRRRVYLGRYSEAINRVTTNSCVRVDRLNEIGVSVSATAEELVDFLEQLEQAGQKCSDWFLGLCRHFYIDTDNGNVVTKFDGDIPWEQRRECWYLWRDSI